MRLLKVQGPQLFARSRYVVDVALACNASYFCTSRVENLALCVQAALALSKQGDCCLM